MGFREGFLEDCGQRKSKDSFWGKCGYCCQPSLTLAFPSQAANLTAAVDEKEQSLQEKAEVILQKEQEIFQLKKGEESVPVEPPHLLPPSTAALKRPGPEAAWTHWCSPLPGLGHDSALLQMHQLQSELEALQSLRAEESEAAARFDVLRLPGPEQGLAHSVPEPHVSPHLSRGPGATAAGQGCLL